MRTMAVELRWLHCAGAECAGAILRILSESALANHATVPVARPHPAGATDQSLLEKDFQELHVVHLALLRELERHGLSVESDGCTSCHIRVSSLDSLLALLASEHTAQEARYLVRRFAQISQLAASVVTRRNNSICACTSRWQCLLRTVRVCELTYASLQEHTIDELQKRLGNLVRKRADAIGVLRDGPSKAPGKQRAAPQAQPDLQAREASRVPAESPQPAAPDDARLAELSSLAEAAAVKMQHLTDENDKLRAQCVAADRDQARVRALLAGGSSASAGRLPMQGRNALGEPCAFISAESAALALSRLQFAAFAEQGAPAGAQSNSKARVGRGAGGPPDTPPRWAVESGASARLDLVADSNQSGMKPQQPSRQQHISQQQQQQPLLHPHDTSAQQPPQHREVGPVPDGAPEAPRGTLSLQDTTYSTKSAQPELSTSITPSAFDDDDVVSPIGSFNIEQPEVEEATRDPGADSQSGAGRSSDQLLIAQAPGSDSEGGSAALDPEQPPQAPAPVARVPPSDCAHAGGAAGAADGASTVAGPTPEPWPVDPSAAGSGPGAEGPSARPRSKSRADLATVGSDGSAGPDNTAGKGCVAQMENDLHNVQTGVVGEAAGATVEELEKG